MGLTRQHAKRGVMDLNMTPMIDVIFQLLIFFMCASSLALVEHQLSSGVVQPAAGKAPDFPPIRVRLDGEGSTVMVRVDDSPISGLAALTDHMRQRQAVAGNVQVIIEGQQGVAHECMVAALEACRKAKFEKVAFSTRKQGP